METANCVLKLEKIFQEDVEIKEEICVEKFSEETFPLSTKGEIKRPRNGFIRYAMEHRTKMASLYPYLENRSISCLLGSKWRKLSEQQRKPYEEEFKEDMKALREKHPNWMYSTSKQNPTDKDLNNVLLPSRLRPRDKIKRKVYPDYFEEIELKSSVCNTGGKRKRRKKKTMITAKVKIENDDDNKDLINKSFFDTILMPPTTTADTRNECSTELDEICNKNLNNNFLDFENEIFKLMLSYSNYSLFKLIDELNTSPENDLLLERLDPMTMLYQNDFTKIKTEPV